MICRTGTKIINTTQVLPYRFEDICCRVVSFCNSKSLKEGVCIHSPIIKLGLQTQDHLYLNNNLLSLYAKCSGVQHARQFFDEMPYKDVVSWTGILSACIKDGEHEEAIEMFNQMMLSGTSPNAFTFSGVLRSCSALGGLSHGKRIHGAIIKNGFESNQILGSALIDLYSKFESCEEAFKLFGYVESGGDTVSWTMMISSFVQAEKWSRAFELYTQMIKAGVSPNEFTFSKLLAASGFLGLEYGMFIHAHMIVLGVGLNLVVKTALVDMYLRCLRMEDAIRVSKLTPACDVLLWTSIISGLAKISKFKEAIAAFCEMEISGMSPNNYTYSSILNACSAILSLDLGRQVHSRVIMAGLQGDVSVGNALVDMYLKCSCGIEDGLRVFGEIDSPDVISWTSLITGFAEHGLQQDAFNSFTDMRADGVQPNSFTLSTLLRACSAVKSPSQTMKLHGYILKTMADHEIIINNALVDAYAGSGKVDDAWNLVRSMRKRDAITYTSLATRLNQMGHHKLALDIISHMIRDDVKLDGFSLASFLSASAGLGNIEIGKQLQCHSVKTGLGSYISVSNGLIDLYGKCGLVQEAHRIFTEITEPDVLSWNALIAGLASHGYIASALSAFDDMRLTGVKPDSVTLLLVLFACNHGGLFDLGLEYFHIMRKMHDIEPQLDHYICLVELLGRAGRLEEAVEVAETMPFRPDAKMYKTLLAACKVHRNVALGEDMARRGLELDPTDPTFYMLLASLYEASGRSDLGEKTRRLMRDKG